MTAKGSVVAITVVTKCSPDSPLRRRMVTSPNIGVGTDHKVPEALVAKLHGAPKRLT